ncbi:hypothetical protein Tco_0772247 [Tanacetum coccineum]|uniref:Gag-pol polyprotein n=1 Tax=Tanacetum coccineum TaxID=301880 RepID=A0ABQ4ZJY2_9ASTR
MTSEVPQTLKYKGEQLISTPLVETAGGAPKLEPRWIADERKAVNLDQCLKSLIISCLPDDLMNYVINCETTKATWEDLTLNHVGPSDVK